MVYTPDFFTFIRFFWQCFPEYSCKFNFRAGNLVNPHTLLNQKLYNLLFKARINRKIIFQTMNI